MKQTIKVLTYHTVNNPRNFERQIAYLIANYNIFDWSSFKHYLDDPRGKENGLLITFDDGDLSFVKNALPILLQYKISPVVFIITSLIGTDHPFWWQEIEIHFGKQQGQHVVRQLKTMTNLQRLDFLQRLRSQPIYRPISKIQMTIDDLKLLGDSNITIANHSHTHPLFSQCTEEEMREDLARARDFFESHNIGNYEIFAYPNGSWNQTTNRVLAEQGIEYAFLFDHRLCVPSNGRMAISRLSVDDHTPLAKLRLILSGWHSRLLPLSAGFRKLFP